MADWPHYGTEGHGDEDSHPAPGDLDLVRAFISLHDHPGGDRDVSLPPSAASVESWLRIRGGLQAPASRADIAWATTVLEDLRAKAIGEATPTVTQRLNAAARRARVSLCFGCQDEGPIHTEATGVRGVVGHLLGIAFLAELEGTWQRLRPCADPTCRSVFWDGSKNRSGRWCSMGTCGNKAKVRAYRERERAGAS
jgi:predicted RNA-binding Zn ribbon-like protein